MKDIINYNLFPTGLQYREGFLTEEECSEILKLAPSEICILHDAFTGNSISSHKSFYSIVDYIDENSNLELGKRLSFELSEFTKTNGLQKCKLSNTWINYQYKGAVLEPHTHPGSIVSCALYIKVDEYSSKINFFNPNSFNEFSPLDVKNYTNYSFQHLWFKPKTGDLFLFPSWLKHGSNGEQSGSDVRVSLSFNSVQDIFLK